LAALLVVAAGVPARASNAATPAAISDWSDEIVYMIMTDRFRNGDPSNDLDSDPSRANWWHGGDLQGVIDELPYIKGLGMTAIWITPVAEQMPGGYHGYWTRDFIKVDPHLGTMAKLQELVTKAHGLGLKVVLDVVLNHVGQGHPWVKDPAHATLFHPECPINFADQRSVEMCWLAGLPDLDTENPGVRALLMEWSFWLVQATGVDGFRIDAARHLSKDFLKAWTAAIKATHPDFWLLGEVYSSGYRYQSGFLEAGLDAVTDFQTYDVIRTGLSEPGNLAQLALPPGLAAADIGRGRENARAIFLDNHDVARFVGRDPPPAVTRSRLRQGLIYLFTMPGTPVLYYGTEIALPGGPDPDNRRNMIWGDAGSEVRDLVGTLAELRLGKLVGADFLELVATQQQLAYARRTGTAVTVVAFNGDPQAPHTVRIPVAPIALGSDVIARDALVAGGAAVPSRDGVLSIQVPARGASVWLVSARAGDAPSPIVIGGALAVLMGAIGLGLVLRQRLSRIARRGPR
jgi:alpha-amylase